ncbi:hypothetical protein DL990_17390 [Amycolatopsis sp. WAC 01416]|uniref:vWA domain-containing protein n=1 Tax=Amycolatopsis sp. WAC 01416 TaxID=2203196 RepID=UPI000F79E8EE|nr:vWA domain-containing protein [Amycolatopsis sp. WAC 01416]RSN31741.1 hypothetical protein DL990_17390 [Amycolatopsis sp. WAC 01416]
MYSAEVNRAQPACLLLLIDQSFSMSDPWSGTDTSKAQALALAVNKILSTAVVLCSKGDDRILDYFHVGVLGYGSEVTAELDGTSISSPLLPVSLVNDAKKRVDRITKKMPDGAGGVFEAQVHMAIWVDAVHNGRTAMVQAFTTAEKALADWCAKNPSSFPPILINITDGVSTDGDPSPVTERIRKIETRDGQALVFNLHISGAANGGICFPSTADGMPDEYASLLFGMSSALPPSMAEAASSLNYAIKPGARGFLYNADAASVIEFLDIGTRAVTPGGLKEITDGN